MLGIDTATAVTSVAVGTETGACAAVSVRHERAHAEVLAPSLRWVLDHAGVEPGSLGGVAVGIGPGLFTGLRVGVATAKALAQAWRLPMVAVSSLDLVAFAHRHTARTVCAVIDARRGELFAALYRHAPGGVQRLSRYAVLRPDRLAAELEARREEVLLCGGGVAAHAASFEHLDERVHLASRTGAAPSAEALIELALPRFHREEYTVPLKVSPMYLRRPDVNPQAGRPARSEGAGARPAAAASGD